MRNIDSILEAIRDVHNKIGTERMIAIFYKHAKDTNEDYTLSEYLKNFENHYSGIYQSNILWEKKAIYKSTKKFGQVNLKRVMSERVIVKNKRVIVKNKFMSYNFISHNRGTVEKSNSSSIRSKAA